jgi:hypothetical protein
LARVRARPGYTRHGTLAGLMIGSVMVTGALAALTGCSSGATSSSAGAAKAASGQAAALAPVSGVAGAAASGAAAPKPGGTGTTTARLAPASDIIYTAQLTVRAASVSSAAAKAAQITQSAGGYV